MVLQSNGYNHLFHYAAEEVGQQLLAKALLPIAIHRDVRGRARGLACEGGRGGGSWDSLHHCGDTHGRAAVWPSESVQRGQTIGTLIDPLRILFVYMSDIYQNRLLLNCSYIYQ
jgi:hypothetical protein